MTQVCSMRCPTCAMWSVMVVTRRLQGLPPTLPAIALRTYRLQEERYETMRHCKWIDEIVVDSPWVISEQFVKDHDIDFVCHDDLPYADTSGASGCGDVYLPLKKIGKFHATQRTEGVSTSDLIVRIVKRYDDYVRRNLSR